MPLYGNRPLSLPCLLRCGRPKIEDQSRAVDGRKRHFVGAPACANGDRPVCDATERSHQDPLSIERLPQPELGFLTSEARKIAFAPERALDAGRADLQM